MSLYETFYEKCVVMDKTKTPDGEGGTINAWTPGAEIKAAFPGLTPTQQAAAQQAAVAYTDTIVTPANVSLDERDIIQRCSGGRYYQVVGLVPGTPGAASFSFARYNVQKLAALP